MTPQYFRNLRFSRDFWQLIEIEDWGGAFNGNSFIGEILRQDSGRSRPIELIGTFLSKLWAQL
jgi:hypothetical protein